MDSGHECCKALHKKNSNLRPLGRKKPRLLSKRIGIIPRSDARKQPCYHEQDERSWTPKEADGLGTKLEKPGMRITGRYDSRAGLGLSKPIET